MHRIMQKRVQTKWEGTGENPDEKHLKALFEEEVASLQAAVAEEEEHARRQKEDLHLLMAATGTSERDLKKRFDESMRRSREAAKEAGRRHAKPGVDFEILRGQDLALAKAIEKKSEGRQSGPPWSGYIWSSSSGGWWSSAIGEVDEVPTTSFSNGANRFDPRAQAWPESRYDADFSFIHAYLAFQFKPPSWGHLHVHAWPWLHGFYSLYSDHDSYNPALAFALVHTWIDVHQNFWRGRQHVQRFSMSGVELHPTRAGRIDGQYGQTYYTQVGESDTVTIRVGVGLACSASACGSHSVLNFQDGEANYVSVPYVGWYLHQ